MKTQNLAILLTDIAGFTAATARQTREENAGWLATHAALLRPAFAAFGGTVWKEMGDAFLCTFPSPTDAVLAGTAVLDRLWAYNQTAPEPMRLMVRVVVNMGEVRLDKGDIYGEPVNVAARVEDVADGGEVTLTEAVFLTMNRSEVELEAIGPRNLHGIPEPVNLYRVKQVAARPLAGALHASYPYGGIQLHRLVVASANAVTPQPQTRGAPAALREASDKAMRIGRSGFDGVKDAASAVASPLGRRIALLVGLIGFVVAIAGGGWYAYRSWRSDPFRFIEERLDARDIGGAGSAWDRADEGKAKPKWRLDYYLGRISALEGNCADLLDAYRDTLKQHPDASDDEYLTNDVVNCLESKRKQAAELIVDHIGKDAIGALATFAGEATKPAGARLSALKLLDKLEAGGKVDQRAILEALVASEDRCQDREEALRRLVERKEAKSLGTLRSLEEKVKGDAKSPHNRCIERPLRVAIEELERD